MVRPLEDDEVDRLEVEVQQCMELTNTNRSRAYPKFTPKSDVKRRSNTDYFSGIPDGLMILLSHSVFKVQGLDMSM
ncbi:hypothetical protein ABD76_15415 [Paenibacillus dendritiformis]|nr:hypothetical protein [Paenibacillus dendritiformis]